MKNAQSKSCGNPASFGKECTSRIKYAEKIATRPEFLGACCWHLLHFSAPVAATAAGCAQHMLRRSWRHCWQLLPTTLCHHVGQSLIFITVDKIPPFVQKFSSNISQKSDPPNVQFSSRHRCTSSSCIHSREAIAKAWGLIFVGGGGSVAAAGLVAAHRQHCGVVVPANA